MRVTIRRYVILAAMVAIGGCTSPEHKKVALAPIVINSPAVPHPDPVSAILPNKLIAYNIVVMEATMKKVQIKFDKMVTEQLGTELDEDMRQAIRNLVYNASREVAGEYAPVYYAMDETAYLALGEYMQAIRGTLVQKAIQEKHWRSLECRIPDKSSGLDQSETLTQLE